MDRHPVDYPMTVQRNDRDPPLHPGRSLDLADRRVRSGPPGRGYRHRVGLAARRCHSCRSSQHWWHCWSRHPEPVDPWLLTAASADRGCRLPGFAAARSRRLATAVGRCCRIAGSAVQLFPIATADREFRPNRPSAGRRSMANRASRPSRPARFCLGCLPWWSPENVTANCRALVRPGTRQGMYPATETPAGTVANAVDALCRPKLRASTPAATGEVSRPDAADVPGAGKGARPTPKEEDELLPETKSRRPLADGAPLRERPRRRLGNDDPWMRCRRWAISARSKARKRPRDAARDPIGTSFASPPAQR